MTKVISLSDDAYAELAALKMPNESFSEVVRKVTKEAKKRRLMGLAGAWKDAPEMDSIFKKIVSYQK